MTTPVYEGDPIDDFTAAEIASLWHSVMTWNDPGVAMYSVTSTGRVHSEKHRAQLLAYIDRCTVQARELDAKADARGEDPGAVLGESNAHDLEALRAWALAYEIEDGEDGDGEDGDGEDGATDNADA